MNCYAFDESLAVGDEGEAALDAYWRRKWLVVTATRTHQLRQKIDRFHIHRDDACILYRVDYKLDRYSTPRLPLEHISVERRGRLNAWGWVHTTEADRIIFYRPHLSQAWVLDLPAIRQAWGEISRFPLWPSATTRGDDVWQTWNRYPTIAWLQSAGIIRATIRLDTTPTTGI